jgi:hypothetical protein
VADADTLVGPDHAVIETVEDHGAVVRRGDHEAEFAADIAHGESFGGSLQAFGEDARIRQRITIAASLKGFAEGVGAVWNLS